MLWPQLLRSISNCVMFEGAPFQPFKHTMTFFRKMFEFFQHLEYVEIGKDIKKAWNTFFIWFLYLNFFFSKEKPYSLGFAIQGD